MYDETVNSFLFHAEETFLKVLDLTKTIDEKLKDVKPDMYDVVIPQ